MHSPSVFSMQKNVRARQGKTKKPRKTRESQLKFVEINSKIWTRKFMWHFSQHLSSTRSDRFLRELRHLELCWPRTKLPWPWPWSDLKRKIRTAQRTNQIAGFVTGVLVKKTKKQKIQNKIKQLKNYCFVEGSVMDISSKPSIDRLVVFSSQKSREICLSSATQVQSRLKDTISVFCCREDRETAWFCNRCLSFQQRTRWRARWRVLNREK